MENNRPPFTIVDEMINLIAIITEKLGKLENNKEFETNLKLRKTNRLKSINSSTAIEGNKLSLKQVTDIINGRNVLGDPKEIREVKNAYKVYDTLANLDPYKIDDFLRMHSLMTDGLIEESGKFRKGNVGVFSGKEVIHLGANPDFVPNLVENLFDWARITDTHPLIKSSVVHFELEFIHPFADGNGRSGRFWQSLILYNWKPCFAYIPIETVIYSRQQEYYDAISISSKEAQSTKFIIFMLNAINDAIDEATELKLTDIITDKITEKLTDNEKTVLSKIVKYIRQYEFIDNKKATEITGKGKENIKKYLQSFVSLGVLVPVGENKGRKYKLNKVTLKEQIED